MRPPPSLISNLPVVLFTPIDWRHEPTDNCRHTVGGHEFGPASGLAICQDGDAYYLFYCDAEWEPVTDTWHQTLEAAKGQAEFEYRGVTTTWESAA